MQKCPMWQLYNIYIPYVFITYVVILSLSILILHDSMILIGLYYGNSCRWRLRGIQKKVKYGSLVSPRQCLKQVKSYHVV